MLITRRLGVGVVHAIMRQCAPCSIVAGLFFRPYKAVRSCPKRVRDKPPLSPSCFVTASPHQVSDTLLDRASDSLLPGALEWHRTLPAGAQRFPVSLFFFSFCFKCSGKCSGGLAKIKFKLATLAHAKYVPRANFISVAVHNDC